MKTKAALTLVPGPPASVAAGGHSESATHDKRNQEQETWFHRLSENSQVGEYILQGGRATYVNPALAKIFGYTQAELVGVDPLSVVHPEDRPMVAEKLRSQVAGEAGTLDYECRGVRKDRQTIEIEVLGGVTLTPEGRPAITGNVLDITERKKAERELRRLSRALLTISRCVQVVTHSHSEEELHESICRNLVEGGG